MLPTPPVSGPRRTGAAYRLREIPPDFARQDSPKGVDPEQKGRLNLTPDRAVDVNLTRRQVIKAALGGAAGLMLSVPRGVAAQTAIFPEALPLADDLFFIRSALPGEANVVAHTSSAGVLLVDGGSAASADELSRIIGRLPRAGQVHTLFNTHWHPEQTGLNERLG